MNIVTPRGRIHRMDGPDEAPPRPGPRVPLGSLSRWHARFAEIPVTPGTFIEGARAELVKTYAHRGGYKLMVRTVRGGVMVWRIE